MMAEWTTPGTGLAARRLQGPVWARLRPLVANEGATLEKALGVPYIGVTSWK